LLGEILHFVQNDREKDGMTKERKNDREGKKKDKRGKKKKTTYKCGHPE